MNTNTYFVENLLNSIVYIYSNVYKIHIIYIRMVIMINITLAMSKLTNLLISMNQITLLEYRFICPKSRRVPGLPTTYSPGQQSGTPPPPTRRE